MSLTPLHLHAQPSGALVLLPGAQMGAADMAQAGLPQVLASSGLPLDLQVPELTLDMACSGNMLQVLAHDMLPSLRSRYGVLWLGGISFGGLLALAHAQRDPEGLAGLCLFAPYLGSRLTTNAIARAGGLDAWQPTPGQMADVEFQLWQGLRDGRPDLPAFVGLGREDRFAGPMREMAARLPQAEVCEVDGGHDWTAWLALWQQCLRWLAVRGGGA